VRAVAARLACVVALCALLYDGSACLLAFAPAPPSDGPQELSLRAPCPCGCAQHLATLVGVGLSQPAAPQALAALPAAPRPLPPPAPALRLPEAPPHGVDHVPISLA
jgi:hypothetical protein